MNWIKIPFCMYLLLKPYYVIASGGIQPADLFLVITLPLFFIFRPKEWILTNSESNNLLIFISFIFYTVIVNLSYIIIHPAGDFHNTILYYMFNLSGIVVFTFLIKDIGFLRAFYNIQSINLIIQSLILISGKGRYLGGVRYMGTFNDPNQLSFYIFLAIISIYALEDILLIKRRRWIIYLIGAYLIISSASTGILLGLVVFFISIFLSQLKISGEQLKKFLKLSLLLLVLGGGLYSTNKESISKKVDYLISRVEDKINSASDDSEVGLLEDRGYDKIYKNAHYLFLGSGEGEMSRLKGYHEQEIHATFPALFLYYGVPGLFLILLWLYRSLSKAPLNQQLVFMALFLESCTLANQRQLLFWGVIILMSKVRKREELTEENN
ncbi:hypothetical protein [Propionigenium maris]|uniref:hypothetical protein n=1 Tax=Propionigenium maris TaxID=45622 RepID=UPI002493A801|nr:hypothetical protein [Propionigenium maris]